jgi:steroid delta-isomerase-like uncharacterized protein
VEGVDAFKEMIRQVRESLSDNQVILEDTITEGDKVVLRWIWHTTHKGEFMGIPATGKRVRFTGMSIARFQDGKLVEGWDEFDLLGLRQQLDAVS